MDIPIWEGQSSFAPGQTPFGFYDNDPSFQLDADKVAKFCASRLGYPIMDVELQSGSFYAAFENAVTKYGNELYAFKIRDNQMSLEGLPTSSVLNQAVVNSNLNGTIQLAKQYGAEAGSGGEVTYHKGELLLTQGVQDYDLNQWAIDNNIDTSLGIEIKKVYYKAPPAISRYYDPYSGTGFGYQALFNTMGFGAYSPSVNYLMMPINFDLLTLQAIEFNDEVRKSTYTFELKNNVLRVFPIPMYEGMTMYFEYINMDERVGASIKQLPGHVTDVSNTPYENPTYSSINSVGRSWIFEYALAISKEMLGLVRNKYQSLKIPDDNVTLNGDTLVNQGQSEQDKLTERLRTYFDETSRKSLLERRSQESEHLSNDLKNIPFTIYIG